MGTDWHAHLPGAPAPPEEPLEVSLSQPPPRLTASFGSRSSRTGRSLALAALALIVLAWLVMFRDPIVQAVPGLSPVYGALGLMPQAPAPPHG